jgi:hypothetical protein
LLKLFHNQFVLIHQAYLTKNAGIDLESGIAMLVPGGIIDKNSGHFYMDSMDETQRQRLLQNYECQMRHFVRFYDIEERI